MSIDAILEAVRTLSPEHRHQIAMTILADEEAALGEFPEDVKSEIDRSIEEFEQTGQTATWEEYVTAARARWKK
jgi:hypothetical protein